MGISEQFILLFTTPILLLLGLIEWIVALKEQTKIYSNTETFTNFYSAILKIPLDLLCRTFGLLFFGFLFKFRLFEITNPWLYWLLLILAGDFCFWIMHFVSHKSRIFWATHCIHHSAKKMNLTVGLRADYWQSAMKFFYYSPIILLGFKGEDVLASYLITLSYGSLLHTESFPVKRLKYLEWILVTPSMHRVHHASNEQYLDKNMGMIFSFWDHIFGTYKEESIFIKPIYGVKGDPNLELPLNVLVHEFNSIYSDLRLGNLSIFQKFKYIFGAPGWSHDSTSQKVKDQQTIHHKVS